MAKISTVKPATIETVTDPSTSDGTNETDTAIVATATEPAAKAKRPRKPRTDSGPAFPWTSDLYDVLGQIAIDIANGSRKGALTLAALQTSFAATLQQGEITFGAGTEAEETVSLSLDQEAISLLTPAEVKKAYKTLAKAFEKEGFKVPEVVSGRSSQKINTSRLAALLPKTVDDAGTAAGAPSA